MNTRIKGLIMTLALASVIMLSACVKTNQLYKDTNTEAPLEVEITTENGSAEQVETELSESKTQEIEVPETEEVENLEVRPIGYIEFCETRLQESRDAMENLLAGARENVYYLLKAYDAMELGGYEEWTSAEEIFSDEILDQMCGGDAIAKAAVTSALEVFSNGDGASEAFGAAMDAAVQEIPNIVRDDFMEAVLGEYLIKSIGVLEDAADAQSAQADYAISLMEQKMTDTVSELVLLLAADEITVKELSDCEDLIKEMYGLILEVNYRFNLSMPEDEWKMLNILISANSDAYKNHARRASLYEAYMQISPETVARFMEDESCSAEELKAIGTELIDYYDLTFLIENSAYLSLKNGCTTLRSMDYAQMSDVAKKNMVLGAANSAFGNFLTDMIMSEVVAYDNEKVKAIYQFTQTCENVLKAHKSGFDGLQEVLDDSVFMVYEFYNTIYAGEENICSLEEQNYMWFILNHYYDGEGKPTLPHYQKKIDEYCEDVRAYNLLLGTYIIPAQKAILNMESDVNKAYIRELESDVMHIDNSLLYLTDKIEMTDVCHEERAITEAYSAVIDELLKLAGLASDTKELRESMYVEGRGNCNILAYMKEEQEIDVYSEPYYVEISIDGKGKIKIYAYGMKVCRIEYADGSYIDYGYRPMGLYMPTHVCATNIEGLDNVDEEWYDNWDLNVCNDAYSYVTDAIFDISSISFQPESKEQYMQEALKKCLQIN